MDFNNFAGGYIQPPVQPPVDSWAPGSLVLRQETYVSTSHKTRAIALAGAPVYFYVGRPRRGIRVSDALANNFSGLEGAQERLVLPEEIKTKINVRLSFQGYAPFQLPKYIRVGEGGEPKTLASFAKILAEVIEQFVTGVVSGALCPTDPSALLFGAPPFTLDNLFITKAEHRSVGSFQVELRVWNY